MQPNPMNQNAYQNPQQYPRKNETTQLLHSPTTNNPCTLNHLHPLLLPPSSTTITTPISNRPRWTTLQQWLWPGQAKAEVFSAKDATEIHRLLRGRLQGWSLGFGALLSPYSLAASAVSSPSALTPAKIPNLYAGPASRQKAEYQLPAAESDLST